jgi:hypothetical protein
MTSPMEKFLKAILEREVLLTLKSDEPGEDIELCVGIGEEEDGNHNLILAQMLNGDLDVIVMTVKEALEISNFIIARYGVTN